MCLIIQTFPIFFVACMIIRNASLMPAWAYTKSVKYCAILLYGCNYHEIDCNIVASGLALFKKLQLLGRCSKVHWNWPFKSIIKTRSMQLSSRYKYGLTCTILNNICLCLLRCTPETTTKHEVINYFMFCSSGILMWSWGMQTKPKKDFTRKRNY